MEKTSGRRMALLYNQFVAHDLMPPTSRERYQQARLAVQRRSGSPLAEGLILLGGYWLTYAWLKGGAVRIDGGTWVGHVEQGTLVVLPLLAATVLPMAAVAATQAPFKEILHAVKGLLLI